MKSLRKPGSPLPEEIQQARQCAGLNTSEAGALVSISGRTLEDYEQDRYAMPPDRWEAFQYKTSLILSKVERQHLRDEPRQMRQPRPTKLARIIDKHFGPPRNVY